MPIEANYLSDISNIATAGALFVGVATLFSSARTTRLQHMHELFKEYLRLRFDYNALVGQQNSEAETLRGNLGGFKMYSIEEMVLWLRRERSYRIFYFWSVFHRQHIDSWQKTIEWHLDQCSEDDFADFESSKSCYGPDMIREIEASKVRTSFAERIAAKTASPDRTASPEPPAPANSGG